MLKVNLIIKIKEDSTLALMKGKVLISHLEDFLKRDSQMYKIYPPCWWENKNLHIWNKLFKGCNNNLQQLKQKIFNFQLNTTLLNHNSLKLHATISRSKKTNSTCKKLCLIDNKNMKKLKSNIRVLKSE